MVKLSQKNCSSFIATMIHQPRVFGPFLFGFLIVVTMMTKLSALESEEEVAWLRG